MAKKREIPDLSNATPEFLVAEIRKARDMQADAKFFEGIYKERLKTFDGFSATMSEREFDSPIGKLKVSITKADVERIDVEAVKAAFTREELIEKKFLVAGETTTLNIKPVT